MILKTLSAILIFLFLSSGTKADQEYMLSFIPATCCVTNECCWKIQESEVTVLPDQEVKIHSTGQIRKYMFSPDQSFYRCACDYDNVSKTWIKHQGANTRCLFVPNRGM